MARRAADFLGAAETAQANATALAAQLSLARANTAAEALRSSAPPPGEGGSVENKFEIF